MKTDGGPFQFGMFVRMLKRAGYAHSKSVVLLS